MHRIKRPVLAKKHKFFPQLYVNCQYIYIYYICMCNCEYEIKIERVFSVLSPEEQERVHGTALWASDPDQCCNLRKVEPLRRKLSELGAWITSIRRDQTSFRKDARKVQWDEKFGLVKVNPIVDWSSKQVWRYLLEHDVPYNSLHDQNYPSIGCTHCTRAIRPGESARAGRWSGSEKTECGLHVAGPAAIAPLVQIKVKTTFGYEES